MAQNKENPSKGFEPLTSKVVIERTFAWHACIYRKVNFMRCQALIRAEDSLKKGLIFHGNFAYCLLVNEALHQFQSTFLLPQSSSLANDVATRALVEQKN